MTENTTAQPAVKRLERSRDDRMLAGVCGGLARYFELNPAVYRVGFGVLTLAAAAAVATAFHVDVGNGIGTRTYVPTAAADVHRDYKLGIGRLQLDLSGVRLPRGETDVDARVGIGDLVVTVPENAAVRVKGDAQVGAVDVFDRHADGHDAGLTVGATGHPALVLHVRAGLGRVPVSRPVR